MFAVVREGTFDPAKAEAARAQMEEFARLRAEQPGYAGSVTVDAGYGRRVIVTLWESEAASEAGRAALEPEAARLLGPTAAPGGTGGGGGGVTQVIARGPVAQTDLKRG